LPLQQTSVNIQIQALGARHLAVKSLVNLPGSIS
jgi:hypothetical protein